MTTAPKRLGSVLDGLKVVLADSRRWRRAVLIFSVYFICFGLGGLAANIILVDLLCLVAPSNRCFRISDLFAFPRLWAVPALVLATGVTLVANLRSVFYWWHAIAVLTVVIVSTEIFILWAGRHELPEVAVAFIPIGVVMWLMLTAASLVAWLMIKPVLRRIA